MNVQLHTLCMAMCHHGICIVIVWLTGLLELLGPFKAGRTTNMRSGVGSSVRACLPLARDRFIGASPTQRFALFPGRTGPGNRMRGPGVGSSVRELRCVTTDIHGYMEMTKFLDKYVNQITPKNRPNYMRVIVELNSCLSIRKSRICGFNCQ